CGMADVRPFARQRGVILRGWLGDLFGLYFVAVVVVICCDMNLRSRVVVVGLFRVVLSFRSFRHSLMIHVPWSHMAVHIHTSDTEPQTRGRKSSAAFRRNRAPRRTNGTTLYSAAATARTSASCPLCAAGETSSSNAGRSASRESARPATTWRSLGNSDTRPAR